MADHEWPFSSRFRRYAFRWRDSDLAIERLKDAVAEIKQVCRKEQILAADGAVTPLAKLSPDNLVRTYLEHLVESIANTPLR